MDNRPRPDSNDETNRLDFFEAMRDFRKMFPQVEDEVIEAVLRANNGAVDDTIDQLLVMSLDKDDNAYGETLPKRIGDIETAHPRVDVTPVAASGHSYHPASTSPKPAQPSIFSTASVSPNLTDQNNSRGFASHRSGISQLPKKVYRPPLVGKLPRDFLRVSSQADPWERGGNSSRPAYSTRRSTIDYYGPGEEYSNDAGRDAPPPSYAAAVGRRHSERVSSTIEKKNIYRSPQHTYLGVFRTTRMHTPSPRLAQRTLAPSTSELREAMTENEWKRRVSQDPELAQYLEDERIAIMLQNEEFMRHLRGDREFLAALEQDAAEAKKRRSPNKSSSRSPRNDATTSQGDWSAPNDDAPMGPFPSDPFPYTKTITNSDDALERSFQEKLALMGRSSKRKFATLARRFISKTRGAKAVLDNNESRTHARLLDSDEESDGSRMVNQDGGYNQPSDVEYNIGHRSDLKEGRFF